MPSLLGSAAVHTPQSQVLNVTPSTCLQLSLFKEVLREYRKLDDSITMRLNRNNAQFRDRERLGVPAASSNNATPQAQACAHIWQELMANWKSRTDIIDYCVKVVDASIEEKMKAVEGQEEGLDANRTSRAGLFAEQVKRNQIHNELAVEAIVRQRALDAFKSRCRYFEPPPSDKEARKWWDNEMAGMSSTR